MHHSLVTYLAESTVCLLAFYLLYLLLLRNEACFRYNRFYLLGATVVSFLLPFMEVPSFQEVAVIPPLVPSLTPYVVKVAVEGEPISSSTMVGWDSVLLLLYGIGVGVFAFRFVRQLYHLYNYIQKQKGREEKVHSLTVIPTHGEWPTFSFFRYIFWDNSQPLTQEEQARILQHERVHVTQGHSYDLVFLELLAIVFWFNPLLFLYRKALMVTHEFLADAQVIQTEDRTGYGLLLARQVLQKNNFTLGHHFNKSLTLKRLKMIHEPNRRTSKVKQVLAFPLLGLLALSLSSNQLATQENASSAASTPAASTSPAEPQFPGGTPALVKFLANEMRIPASSQKNNEYGGVFVQVTVAKDGTPGNFKVLQARHASLEQEVLRVVKLMPTWEAHGATSPVTYVIPFAIIIDGFKNDKNAIKQEFEQDLTKVTAQFQGKAFKIAPPIYLTGYGPLE
ncbi:M56 family metallopeptidase [Rufibacter glacialis]|uniref:M56 family metallopeptidase n=1 Tax=Rufibacter glacialis TaxID=1259555 RepID=A0A5M8QP23_9BACT|nr:M56 family metallopeptidase [Rufibacter glacialis]KAA6437819.1 hypothetical protein FOE74_04785 [Rufibacter glacialis]GGK56024.1 hypothetical protein GCM10011405_00160 [Rufibacter glacialis]